MTRLRPAAYLAVDGVDVARSTVAGVPTTLLALDGAEVTWGREEPLDQQQPAYGSAAVFDPARTWHRTRQLVGAVVTLRWEVTVAGVTTSRTFFRGRIGKVNPVLTELAGVRGILTTLELTSLVTDLGNVVPSTTWPSLNLANPAAPGSHLARLSAAVVAAGITGGVTSPATLFDNFATSTCNAPDQLSLADHVSLFYDTTVQRMNYSPHNNGFTAAGTRDFATRNSLGKLAYDVAGSSSDRAGLGVYAKARDLTGPAGLYLNAREAEYPEDAGLSRDQTSAISRIRLTTYDYTNSVEVKSVYERVVANANETLYGVRTMTVDSGASSTSSTRQLDAWESLVRQDAAAWRLEPLTYDTAATGGFQDLAQLLGLLSGEESNQLLFLEGSAIPLYGSSPVVGVMGGTITTTGGQWQVVANLLPVTTPARQHAVTAEELDTAAARIETWDTPHPLGLHASLTWEDLAWVGLGLGTPETNWFPVDNGWDYYQQ